MTRVKKELFDSFAELRIDDWRASTARMVKCGGGAAGLRMRGAGGKHSQEAGWRRLREDQIIGECQRGVGESFPECVRRFSGFQADGAD